MKCNQTLTLRLIAQLRPGFTLVEMLLVLVILTTLAAIVLPNMFNKGKEGRITATKVQLQTFRSALAAFEMDNDHYPQGRTGLQDLVQRPREARNWRGPYLDGGLPKDPWGNDYVYECPGRHNPQSYDIASAGPDGHLGTDDDIGNWPTETRTASP